MLAMQWDIKELDANAAPTSKHMTLMYDQIYSQKFFGTLMQPLWRKGGVTPEALLQQAEQDYATDLAASSAYDAKLVSQLAAKGGDKYATMGALVHRQVFGGTEAV